MCGRSDDVKRHVKLTRLCLLLVTNLTFCCFFGRGCSTSGKTLELQARRAVKWREHTPSPWVIAFGAQDFFRSATGDAVAPVFHALPPTQERINSKINLISRREYADTWEPLITYARFSLWPATLNYCGKGVNFRSLLSLANLTPNRHANPLLKYAAGARN